MPRQESPIEHAPRITHGARILFPGEGGAALTKDDLAAYYTAMAPFLLPFLARRPVSLERCPEGIDGGCFYQKHRGGGFGPPVHAVTIREADGTPDTYLWLDDAAGILACVQMNTIEFHGWGARIRMADDAGTPEPMPGGADVEHPDRIVFDLDPDEDLGFDAVRDAARLLRDRLADIGLGSHAMLTGGKGIHVIVPIAPEARWPAVRDFAHGFADAAADAMPDRFTTQLRKVRRTGRIFIDWLRNQRGATAIMPYSVRAHPHAPVATPVAWDALDSIDSARHFTAKQIETMARHAREQMLAGWGTGAYSLPRAAVSAQ